MYSERTPAERRIDAALLLALWANCAQRPREDAGDKLRQMKLAFLAANELSVQQIHALSLSFYRWTWGPMSNEVYEAWELLKRASLIESEEHFVFTREGEALARDFAGDVLGDERNAPIRAVFDALAGRWQDTPSTGPLLDHVYALSVRPLDAESARPIAEIRKGAALIEPVEPATARTSLFVDRGWLETLALLLVPGASGPIHAAVDDFRAGNVRVLTH